MTVDEAHSKLKKFVERNRDEFHVPTLREVQNFAKENNLPLTNSKVSDYLRQNYKYYAETNFNRQIIKYPLRVAVTALGCIGIDLAWFGGTKAFKEYGIVEPKVYCYLTAVCLLSKQVFIEPVPRGKSFANLKKPLENIINNYRKLKNVPVTSVASDKERALTGVACQNFFTERGIRHFTFSLTSRKNSVTENANKIIRQDWTKFVTLYPTLKENEVAQKVSVLIKGSHEK